MISSTAMDANPATPTITTDLALHDSSFRLKGKDIQLKKGHPGCRIEFHEQGERYYGVIVERLTTSKFTVSPPDNDWVQISGGSVFRGWHDWKGTCQVRKETIVVVVQNDEMLEIRTTDPFTEVITDDIEMQSPNDGSKESNDANEGSKESNDAEKSDEESEHSSDDDESDDDDESAADDRRSQSTIQSIIATTPPPASPNQRKSSRKQSIKKFFDDDDYHN